MKHLLKLSMQELEKPWHLGSPTKLKTGMFVKTDDDKFHLIGGINSLGSFGGGGYATYRLSNIVGYTYMYVGTILEFLDKTIINSKFAEARKNEKK